MNVNCWPSLTAPLQQDATTHWGPTGAFASRGTLMLTPASQEPAVKVGLFLVHSDFIKCFTFSGPDTSISVMTFSIRLLLWLPFPPQQRGPRPTQTCHWAFPQPPTRLAARLPTRPIILRAATLPTTVRLELQVLQAPPEVPPHTCC